MKAQYHGISLGVALAALLIGGRAGFALDAPASEPRSPALGVVGRAAAGADESWLRFQSGKRLFEERRFGEALIAFQDAAAIRRQRFAGAETRLSAALSDREAALAGDSLPALIDRFAKRDLSEREYAALRASAGDSLRTMAELLRERRLSDSFAGFLDALILVLDHRSASSLGDSLSRLRLAVRELADYPEAEYWIGRVYLVEGETRLAEPQFRRAYEMRASLEIPEDRFRILMALSSVYRDLGEWNSYEARLKEAADSGPEFGEGQRFLREAMERSVARDGIDKFLTLYRAKGGPWTEAQAELGSFYLANGRPQALTYLSVAANALVARVIERLREAEPSYAFLSLAETLSRIDAHRDLSRYAEEANLYRTLYELGEALWVQGHRDSARGLWRSIAANKRAGPWGSRAAMALARSFR